MLHSLYEYPWVTGPMDHVYRNAERFSVTSGTCVGLSHRAAEGVAIVPVANSGDNYGGVPKNFVSRYVELVAHRTEHLETQSAFSVTLNAGRRVAAIFPHVIPGRQTWFPRFQKSFIPWNVHGFFFCCTEWYKVAH